jgi:hypothetical protein
MKADDPCAAPLQHHMEYLLELGEVRATHVVATLVDGVQGHENREDTVDNVYLPMSMGYRNCYKRYMNLIGFKIRCNPKGVIIVDGIEMEDNKGGRKKLPRELGYVCFTTYVNNWKKDSSQLKVSHPAEDFCQYCFVFLNHHRYFADHSAREALTCGIDSDNNSDIDAPGEVIVECGGMGTTTGDLPESAASQEEDSSELMVLEAAKHVCMARAQRALYQMLVADVVSDAVEGKDPTERRYTFVVDYGQNMELPVYYDEQPGCTYYYSPLSVYNLGVVNHAHRYENRDVGKHMYAHVYHEGNGAKNVASFIVKTLRQLNLLREDSVGGELNIIFDNDSGQNKNNTVLKMVVWIKQMGHFKNVNFVFLVVGHTKNAADSLFNSLKVSQKESLYHTEFNCGIECVRLSDGCANNI